MSESSSEGTAPDAWKSLVEGMHTGKRVGGSVYVHLSALPDELAGELERAAVIAQCPDGAFNVVRLGLVRRELSLLSYPTFFVDAFPVLAESWTVDLAAATYERRGYPLDANPPVLHRKELLLRSDGRASRAVLAKSSLAARFTDGDSLSSSAGGRCAACTDAPRALTRLATVTAVHTEARDVRGDVHHPGFVLRNSEVGRATSVAAASDASRLALELRLRRLNDFYGRVQIQTRLSKSLFSDVLKNGSKPAGWYYLANVAAVNADPLDHRLMEEIIAVNRGICDLITAQGGLIRSPHASFTALQRHVSIVEATYRGKPVSPPSGFDVYPKEFDKHIDSECDALRAEIAKIDGAMATTQRAARSKWPWFSRE